MRSLIRLFRFPRLPRLRLHEVLLPSPHPPRPLTARPPTLNGQWTARRGRSSRDSGCTRSNSLRALSEELRGYQSLSHPLSEKAALRHLPSTLRISPCCGLPTQPCPNGSAAKRSPSRVPVSPSLQCRGSSSGVPK